MSATYNVDFGNEAFPCDTDFAKPHFSDSGEFDKFLLDIHLAIEGDGPNVLINSRPRKCSVSCAVNVRKGHAFGTITVVIDALPKLFGTEVGTKLWEGCILLLHKGFDPYSEHPSYSKSFCVDVANVADLFDQVSMLEVEAKAEAYEACKHVKRIFNSVNKEAK